jgi:dicarboxylate transporter 10
VSHFSPNYRLKKVIPSQLSASLLRQLTYSTTRFGVYEELKSHISTPVATNSLPALIGLASISGFLGGLAGNPADVINVRMQHDAALAVSQQRNYKHAVDGVLRITREEGWQALFRGVWPNSFRAALMTASQLASYDAFKSLLLHKAHMADDLQTHFAASVAAGFVATTICSPVDVLKTRLMSAKQKEGVWALLKGVWHREGLAWVFKGWVPSFVRLGPHTVVTFLALEQHKKLYRRFERKEDL